MKCPNCHHNSEPAQVKCSACAHVYDRDALEQFEHLQYLLEWLAERQQTGDLRGEMYASLHGLAAYQLETVQDAWRALPVPATQSVIAGDGIKPIAPLPSPVPIPAPAVSRPDPRTLALVIAARKRLAAWETANILSDESTEKLNQHLKEAARELRLALNTPSATVETPTEAQLADFVKDSAIEWHTKGLMTLAEAHALRRFVTEPPVSPQPSATPATAAPAPSAARAMALLESTQRRLPAWVTANIISPASSEKLDRLFNSRLKDLRLGRPDPAAAPAPADESSATHFILNSISAWRQENYITLSEAANLRQHLQASQSALPRPVPVQSGSVATPFPSAPAKPVVPPAPVAPPKPPRPPINWSNVWDKVWGLVVSGALLRGLLYLGAFMIVVSAVVLVVAYWQLFSWPVQIGFISAVPLAFYASGFFLRSRLKIPVAGGVFTGIGAVLVAVDFAAVYQLGGLSQVVDVRYYWLFASLFCLAIYIFTTWRVRVNSLPISPSSPSPIPSSPWPPFSTYLEWRITSATASATNMVAGAAWLKGRQSPAWQATLDATRRLPYLLIPVSLFLILFVPGQPAWGQMAAFLFAALAYGLLAWRFPSSIFAHAASWSLVGALGFGLRAIALPSQWVATAAALLSPLYLFTGQWLKPRLGQAKSPTAGYPVAVHLTGFALLFVAVVAGSITIGIDVWAGVTALMLASAVLAWCAYLFHRPAFVALAAFLLIAPVTIAAAHQLALTHINQQFAWLMLVWSGLALSYLSAAAVLRRAERYVVWLNVWAHLLAPFGLIGLIINYAFTRAAWNNIPTLLALTGVETVYIASAALHHRGRHPALSRLINWLPNNFAQGIFLWPSAFLLPVLAAVAWWGSPLPHTWFGAVLAALALAYAGLGQWLHNRQAGYRLPLHFYSYVLIPLGVLVALSAKLPLMTTLYLSVVVLGVFAALYRSYINSTLASALFLWPVFISLQLLNVLPHAFSLAYALLAALGYLPLGLWLAKQGRQFALPQYIFGHALALGALAASLAGRFGGYSVNLPWVGVAVPLVVMGQQLFSLYRFRRVEFGWAAVAVFPIAFGQALTLIGIRSDYLSVAWVGLGFAYLLAERALATSSSRPRLAAFTQGFQLLRLPLTLGVLALAGLGVALTVPDTLKSFVGLVVAHYFAPILAQSIAFLLVIAASRLHHSRWPMFIAPPLAFTALTLAFIGYPYPLTGRALTAPEFALVWSGLGLAHLVAGALLDRNRVRYSHALYLGGYGLLAWALLWSIPDRLVNIFVLALALVAALASHVLTHYGLHKTFSDFLNLFWKKPGSVAYRAAHTVFLFFASYGLVIWLAQVMAYNHVPLAWQGLGLALAAPLYIAFGLAARRVKAEYTWPLYSAGYALTAIGALLSFRNETLAFYVLALDAVVYAASAYIFRQSFWLYLSNVLVPVLILLALHLNQSLNSFWVASLFMGLAFVYFGLGQWFNRGQAVPATHRMPVKDFALAFLAPAYVLSAVALAVASGEKSLAIEIYSAGIVLYAASAWVHREPVFLYPAVWLSAVPYYLLMTLTPLPAHWYGLGWLPLIVTLILLGKFVFHKQPLGRTFAHPALPFYLLAYTLSVSMLVVSQTTALTFTVALAAATVLYFASAALFKRAAWLFPGLFTLHFALLSYFAIHPTNQPAQYLALPFLGLTWLVALAGYALSRWLPVPRQTETGRRLFKIGPQEFDFGQIPVVGYLFTPSWSQPFFIFTALDVLVWQSVAQGRYDTAVMAAVGFMLLLMLFATLWQDSALAYGTLGFLTLAVITRLAWTNFTFAECAATLGGLGFGLYLLARLINQASPVNKSQAQRLRAARVWISPLTSAAALLTGLGVVLTLPYIVLETLAPAAALAFAGALYLTLALRGRYYRLGYLGMAMLQMAWVLVLVWGQVSEPQWYAIPAGLYFTGMGYLERRRSNRLFAVVIEVFGLAVLLLTTFIQSLKGGPDGLPFFILMLVEGLLVIAWGASRRLKLPFFIELGASALNVAGQIVVLFNGGSTLARWTIIGTAGLLLVFAAVFVERQRTYIVSKAQEWRETLETWE